MTSLDDGGAATEFEASWHTLVVLSHYEAQRRLRGFWYKTFEVSAVFSTNGSFTAQFLTGLLENRLTVQPPAELDTPKL